ncbi:MAG TPA: hypothetical protein VLZ83_12690 [Edaphocola sp.]|nr:hypothetical protein [Edaphocola sp.]
MNYYYILIAMSFIIFGIHSSISSRIKDGEMLATGSLFPNMLLRTTPFIGYIILAINLYYTFYWIYAILIFFVGLLIVPAAFVKTMSLIIPPRLFKTLFNPYPNTILIYIGLSVVMIVLLTINLF